MMGVPWVAPDIGGVTELHEAGAVGLMYQRVDLHDAAEKVKLLLTQSAAMTAQARAAVPKIQDTYSLAKMTAGIYGVFDVMAAGVKR